MKSVSIIVAYDLKRLIGAKNKLPWYLPADLKRFKELTSGNAIIMGRATYESIGRPLPNRRNIVLTRQSLKIGGCSVVNSLDAALELVPADEEAFVIGGAQIYTLALPLANKLYVTEVNAELEGDVYFPRVDMRQWQEVSREEHQADKDNPYAYNFINYVKKS